ncbi:MAG: hypothetical protein MR639_03095 [Clostridium sp.]|uniref:hypothetical protein n=1 Tax=Clostridium sp. TaxID=1506 RepID=UPI002A851818|nr:hypothetical protein [Clostridium sp.]MDY5099332.1 hypothetical protein [Clostridium sp.]
MSNSLSNLNFQDIIDSCADLRSQLDRSDVETIIVNDFTKTFESNYTEGKEIYQNLKDGISEFYSSMNETADYTPYDAFADSIRQNIMDEKDSLLLYSYAAYKKTRISSDKSKEFNGLFS